MHVAEEAVQRLEVPVPGRANTTMISDVRRNGGGATYEVHHLACFWPGAARCGRHCRAGAPAAAVAAVPYCLQLLTLSPILDAALQATWRSAS